MISFARNHEDVLLARALAGETTGFYVDVGAFDPVKNSVTQHFYDLGWQGINIEPQRAYADRLRDARPRDVTVEAALSDHRGTGTLYEATIGDGVATIDEANARRLRDRGKICGETSVQLRTLADVLDEHMEVGTQISFLKVDVEGHERAVLSGGDWARHVPRIVVVETTEPVTLTPSHQPWEPLLIGAGYAFVQFDGLNRWYARSDDNRLIESLSVPVSALDKYAPYAWVAQVRTLQAEVDALTDKLAEATAAPVRKQNLISALQSLQERYERLSEALGQEQTLRVIEADRISELARAVKALAERAAS